MIKLLALDLSTKRTGVSIFIDGKFHRRYSITPNEKDDNFHKIKMIVDSLREDIKSADDCTIEDIFLAIYSGFTSNVGGFALLARLSGAVINEWLNHHTKIPVLYKATEARKLAGIKGTCQKCEVQIFIAQYLNIISQEQLDTFQGMIEAENGSLHAEEITKVTWKKHMDIISKYIEDQIELSEDEADAVLLGLSFFEAKKQGRV